MTAGSGAGPMPPAAAARPNTAAASATHSNACEASDEISEPRKLRRVSTPATWGLEPAKRYVLSRHRRRNHNQADSSISGGFGPKDLRCGGSGVHANDRPKGMPKACIDLAVSFIVEIAMINPDRRTVR